MSEKKLSIIYLNQKKETLNTVKILEEGINTVKDKINKIKKSIHRKKREVKRGKLSSTRKKKFELNIIELENNLEVLTDFKNELQTRLDTETQKLTKLQQKIRDNRKYGDINPFELNDINQDADEITLNEFLDLAENHKTKYCRFPIFDLILHSQRHRYLFFILNGEFTINDGKPYQVNRFYKDYDQLTKSIEKMIDKHDEALEVLFSGEMNKYTLVFNKVKRSNYGTGCDIQQKKAEYESDLVCIPEANECFRKCIDSIHQRDYCREYREFIRQSGRCKNIMTQAKIQPFVEITISI